MSEKEINVVLSVEELNVVLDGLANLPFKVVYKVIQKIQTQANGQLSTLASVENQVDG